MNPVRRAVWYGFSTWTPAEGRAQRTLVTSTTVVDAENGEVEPADAGEEQHGRERGRVDERRAEIRLEEDEREGHEPEPDRGQHRPQPRHPAATLDEEPRDREHEDVFPNSDGWSWKGPRSIHRFEPRTASAKTKTKSTMPIVAP